MNNKFGLIGVSLLSVLTTLAACGGGGDGGAAAPPPAPKAWGTASLIETDNAGNTHFPPQIAIDANGNALAVWPQSDGTRNNIWATRYQ